MNRRALSAETPGVHRSGARQTTASADAVPAAVPVAPDSSEAGAYGPPAAAIRQCPDAAVETLRQFTAWG